jgi:hypothetical protein
VSRSAHSPEFSPRPRYIDEFIVVDGITRAGKFMIGAALSGVKRVEFVQPAPLLTTIPYLHRLGKLDTETAKALMRTEIAARVYDRVLGRNLNGRSADLSCIYRAPDFKRYLSRAAAADGAKLSERFLAEKRLPLFVAHDALGHAALFFDAFPRAKLIYMMRDPVSLVESWSKRGWGKRFGTDPRSMDLAFKSPRGPIPWYAVGWKKNYHALSENDRIVRSLETAMVHAKAQYKALPVRLRARVAFATFEDLAEDPRPTMKRLSRFLGSLPSPLMAGALKRERLPRPIDKDRRAALLRRFSKTLSSDAMKRLTAMAADYDGFWRSLAS